jgi:hypothetical protein
VFYELGFIKRQLSSYRSEIIPEEIDVHLALFGKEPWEVEYGLLGYCDMCNTRIDEFGYCACGGAAD